MGGTMQFRSQAEIGYRFDNNMRLTTEFSHISDAKTTRLNPGAEIIGLYLHVPTLVLFGLGVVPGLISTVIFALPAPIRLTQLGISSVPKALLEDAKTSTELRGGRLKGSRLVPPE